MHTPGPWTTKRAAKPVDGEYDFAIVAEIAGAPFCIAEAFGRVAEELRPDAEANARLIAAAPKLLAALKTFVEYEEPGAMFAEHVQQAIAAINEAEGRTE